MVNWDGFILREPVMIPKENIAVANSLEDFFSIIDLPNNNRCRFFSDTPKMKNDKPIFWFRGHTNLDWCLQPSLYRKIGNVVSKNPKISFWKYLSTTEELLIEEFKVRNYHLLKEHTIENKYLWLTLMQHNSLSTRLLDWTEQVVPSLYFALSDFFHPEHLTTNTLPCVWVLRPLRYKFREIDLFNKIQKGKRISESYTTITSLFELSTCTKARRNLHSVVPMPVLAPYNNERIHAQSGVFSIFPMQSNCCNYLHIDPLEFCLENLPYSEEFLLKIIISSPKHVSDQLKQIGLKRSVFFPEIPNVSYEIEDQFLRDIVK